MKGDNERCILVLMSYYKILSSTYTNYQSDFELKWHINKKKSTIIPNLENHKFLDF
jgi:hypothetical protein